MVDRTEAEVAIIGAGAAGLSLAHHLLAAGAGAPDIALIEAPPGPLRPPERTWCFWEEGPGRYDEVLSARWSRLRVKDREGTPFPLDLGPYRYKMLRSGAFERFVADGFRGRSVRRFEAAVDEVRDTADGAEVRAARADGGRLALRARWVFDSRPVRRLPDARTHLLQHFRGWFVRSERPVFDPATADLMDFHCPQPARGLAFVYALPLSDREALVEYTLFSADPLPAEAYRRALRSHLRGAYGLTDFEIGSTESGVIPMTDGRFPGQAGARVFRIGTAGGATRPSTGYTFAAVQRQSRAIAAALRRGGTPRPPAAYPARARLLDAVMLHALDSGRLDGPRFFTDLFRTVPAPRLLRFLDGETGWRQDLAIGLRVPIGPMAGALARLPLLPKRPAGRRPPVRPAHGADA
ncbi:lycopene cyclase family protein [Phaeacidiphilus oryzae]|uniref:lycopene cyclase family protein n=1 Tax=Phaeacidiphilus oryzae TaxID=348818 RepID=UPI000563F27E|nr:lycopene cyclase family protein [Phaeacidiphilus oryzae]